MRRRRIYEGKAKVLFEGPQPGTLVQYFKDDADNKRKPGIITGKGVLNNRISEYLMVRLAEIGVPTHFMRRLNMREQLVRELEIIQIEVAVELGSPLVAEEHITAFGWAATQEIDDMMQMALRINDFLCGLFHGVGLRLVDFRLEFGRLWEDEEPRIVLADEISPDSCRLWDLNTNEKLDKDRFDRDLGSVEQAYQEVARRLGVLPEAGPIDIKGPKLMQ
jgi:phosphoribosylaminoimidazole-succinocarboxamide synthase